MRSFSDLFPSQPSAPSNDIDVAPPHEEDDEDATPHDDHDEDATPRARERAKPSFEPDIALGGVGFCSVHAQSEIDQKRRLGPADRGNRCIILMLTTQPFDPLTSSGTK